MYNFVVKYIRVAKHFGNIFKVLFLKSIFKYNSSRPV